MRWISNKTVKIGGIYSSVEEAFEFCWSSFAGEHNTLVKSTRRNVELNKFGCGTPWLPDILCKQRFTSSVWDFCRWVADVPPRETSPAAKGEEKRLFSKAIVQLKVDICGGARSNAWTTFIGTWKISNRPYDSPYQVEGQNSPDNIASHNCRRQSDLAKQTALLRNFKVFLDE